MRDILEDSREILLLSNTYFSTPHGLGSSTASQFRLHLPEVWAPARYLVEVGLQPALARRLSGTYMDFVDRYRKTCQLHFDRVTHGDHLTEYYHEVFIVLFKRMIQALGSQLLSTVRVQLCQAGARQATIRPERVNVSKSIISETLAILNSLSYRYAWMMRQKPKSLRGLDLKLRISLPIE